uniref:Ig-like domain-containing protein n=1 Tax=Paramormyrops kingsleyae TaxID=1676925 RepID=A0A3B3RBP2_9TELE
MTASSCSKFILEIAINFRILTDVATFYRIQKEKNNFSINLSLRNIYLSFLFRCLVVVPTGADSVSSVRRVTVQSGGSVTIPCLYEDTYKNHVKYWCRGREWQSCTPIVRTDSPQKKGDVSIRDDPDQRVFTVTMNNLTTEDADYYCGHSDFGDWVELSVTDGKMSVLQTAFGLWGETGVLRGNPTMTTCKNPDRDSNPGPRGDSANHCPTMPP